MNNADIIIEVLSKKGFSLTTDGSHIFCTGPEGKLTPDLKQLILHYKGEIIEHLEYQQMSLMKVKDFARGSYAVRIYSKVLDREIYYCSNEAMRDSIRETGLSAYMPDELAQIVVTKPDEKTLRAIDIMKQVFPSGTIVQ